MKSISKTYHRTGFCTRFLLCLLTVGMVLSMCSGFVSAAGSQETPSEKLIHEEVKKIITDYWNEHTETSAGMAVAVFDRNGIIYTDTFGYADKEQNIKLEKGQVLDWGSISKTLIWVSAMQLKEQGKLDLNRDIRDYLPEGFLTHLHYDKPITMLHLMNHTAGFEELMFELETPDANAIIPLGEFLKTYQPNQAFEPGLTVAYSNWGAALAGYVIECISGEPYADYVHQHIFEPLHMQHSALYPDLSDDPEVAENRKILKGYTRDGESAGDCYRYILAYPAGMCTSDIADLTTYAQALADPETILFQDKATYQELFTTTHYLGDTDIPVICHGFWQSEYGENVIGHGGNTSSCSSQLQFDSETGVGMVVMTNQIGERNFCNDMVKLIMTEPAVDQHEGVNGKVLILPTVLNGPFKLLSLGSVADVREEMFSNYLCDRQTTDQIDRIDAVEADFIVLSSGDIAAMYIPILLWGAALIFAVLSLLVKFVRMVVRKIKKQDNTILMGKWSAVSSLLIIGSLLLLVPCADSLMNEMWSINGYRIWSICYLVLAAIMILVLVTGCIRIGRNPMSVRRRIYNGITILMTAAGIYNIIYWQLYTFWLL